MVLNIYIAHTRINGARTRKRARRRAKVKERYRDYRQLQDTEETSPSSLLATDTISNCNSPLTFTKCR